ncbi:MAG: hypothetical protein ACRCUT_07135, partial [Spirochaetota bacterium]
MWNKLLFRSYFLAGHILFVIIIITIALPLYNIALNDEYFILYFTLICIAFFPVLDYCYSFVERLIYDQTEKIISPEKIDSVLQAQNPGDMINAGFVQILNTFS